MNTLKIEINGVDFTALAQNVEIVTKFIEDLKPQNEASQKSEKLITRAETAQMLGVTLPTIYDWTKKGIITAYRIGNRVRYKHDEILEAVTSNKTH